MSLIVRIYINDTHIGTEAAQRIAGGTNPDDINTYKLKSNGKCIKHCYGDGAAALAEKMMSNLKKREKKYGLPTYREPLQRTKNSRT